MAHKKIKELVLYAEDRFCWRALDCHTFPSARTERNRILPATAWPGNPAITRGTWKESNPTGGRIPVKPRTQGL